MTALVDEGRSIVTADWQRRIAVVAPLKEPMDAWKAWVQRPTLTCERAFYREEITEDADFCPIFPTDSVRMTFFQ
jgi:hypothetical protein